MPNMYRNMHNIEMFYLKIWSFCDKFFEFFLGDGIKTIWNVEVLNYLKKFLFMKEEGVLMDTEGMGGGREFPPLQTEPGVRVVIVTGSEEAKISRRGPSVRKNCSDWWVKRIFMNFRVKLVNTPQNQIGLIQFSFVFSQIVGFSLLLTSVRETQIYFSRGSGSGACFGVIIHFTLQPGSEPDTRPRGLTVSMYCQDLSYYPRILHVS